MIQTRSLTNTPIDRAFLDACVLYSAALGGPGSSKLWSLEQLRLVTNEYALVEAHLNLQNRGESGPIGQFDRLIQSIEVASYSEALLDRHNWQQWQLPDPNDVPILLGAIEARCTYLVTLDSACFGRFFGKQVNSVTILKPGKLLILYGK